MDWQGVIVALLVLGAAAYLARRSFGGRSRGGGCGGCEKGCGAPTPEESAAQGLVQIETRPRPGR